MQTDRHPINAWSLAMSRTFVGTMRGRARQRDSLTLRIVIFIGGELRQPIHVGWCDCWKLQMLLRHLGGIKLPQGRENSVRDSLRHYLTVSNRLILSLIVSHLRWWLLKRHNDSTTMRVARVVEAAGAATANNNKAGNIKVTFH